VRTTLNVRSSLLADIHLHSLRALPEAGVAIHAISMEQVQGGLDILWPLNNNKQNKIRLAMINMASLPCENLLPQWL